MKLEIWIEFASTYSYLTVCRAQTLLKSAKVDYVWRPFLLGPIFKARGLETSPFVLDPLKGAYMWRDVERRAAIQALPFERPSVFPANGLTAARIMTAALSEPWCEDFARAVFEAEFANGEDISDLRILSEALMACGAEPSHWLAVAQSEPTKQKLRACTERAKTLGIFGAPSFVVGEELFWGDDRFEDAVNWAQNCIEPR